VARRQRTSLLEDLLDLIASLPWWACVALALLSYVLLHSLAAQPALAVPSSGPKAIMVWQNVWRLVAGLLQYIVPLICLIGAGASAWRRHQRKSLAQDVAQSHAGDAIDGMSWREFEMLVGEGFRMQGFRVVETGGGGADGGVDLVLSKPAHNGSEKFLVQCKHWRALRVGVDVVRELYGVMAAKGATGGFVVTSGRFTAEAHSFASGRNVTLMDGPQLHAMLRRAQAKVDPASTSNQTPPAVHTSTAPTQSPSCPVCAKPLVIRTAKRGPNAGGQFWGCRDFPACGGTLPIG
jgi:restriction system protein